MTTMFDNLANRDLLRLLTKSLLMLEISDDPVLRKDLIANVDRMLEQTSLELKTERNINMFKQSLEGNRIAEEITFSSTARPSTFDEIATGGPADDRNTEESSTINADRSAVGEMDNNSINDQSHVSEEQNAAENTSILVTSPIFESVAHETTARQSSSSPQSPPSKRQTPKRRNKPIESPKTSSINTAASKAPTSKTPTTYGPNNSTQTRNLRKSMHGQRLSVSDDVSRKQPQSARLANVRTNVRAGSSDPTDK